MNWLPGWLERKRLNNQKDERNWASRRGGRTQSNSGRNWYAKGDVKDTIFLTDTKETTHASFRVSVAQWNILTRWASREHLTPCLKIKFVGSVSSRGDLELVVLPADFLEGTM